MYRHQKESGKLRFRNLPE